MKVENFLSDDFLKQFKDGKQLKPPSFAVFVVLK